jgi:pyruvate,orthophosphate dikinase
MPGMMETVLNVGLNDESVEGLARPSPVTTVRVGLLPPTAPDVRQDRARSSTATASRTRSTRSRRPRAPPSDPTSTPTTCATSSRPTRRSSRGQGASSRRIPASSSTWRSEAVFDSWNTDRARLYRRRERIPEDLGTAVNVQAMVFGNRGDGLGHRRLPSPVTRRPPAPGCLRRLPPKRPGRGRRRRHPQHPDADPTWSGSTRSRTTS